MVQAPIDAYEAIRTDVMSGTPRPEGIAALRYHGMLHGLPLLVETRPIDRSRPSSHPPATRPLQQDGEFVRLLANLVLHTHSELAHVY